MPSFTWARIRSRAEAHADIPACSTSTHVTLVQMNEWLNLAYFRYYRLLAECGAGFIADSLGTETTMTGATANIALAADFAMMVAVERKVTDDQWKEVKPIHRGDAVRHAVSATYASGYLPQGANITLYPRPTQGVYRIRYIPGPTEITSDAATVDDHFGWSEMISMEAAVKALLRKEKKGAAQDLAALLDKVEKEIEAYRVNRVISTPRQVRDVDFAPPRWPDEEWT